MTMPNIAALGGTIWNFPPNIPEICRGCCNRDRPSAHRDGANLSDSPNHPDRAAGCGKLLGCSWSSRGRPDVKVARTGHHHRERQGAAGTIGTGRAARAVPDGYTIAMGFVSSHAPNGAFYSLSYDVLNDFAPISPLITGSVVLYARKTMPAKDLRELIACLKSNPNKASAGVFRAPFDARPCSEPSAQDFLQGIRCRRDARLGLCTPRFRGYAKCAVQRLAAPLTFIRSMTFTAVFR
jgi:hypothetical protein